MPASKRRIYANYTNEFIRGVYGCPGIHLLCRCAGGVLMGMYTEIVAGIALKKGTPKIVIDALDYMCGNTDTAPKKLPDHRLFNNPEGRWAIMLQCSSHYFPYHESLTRFKQGPDYAPEHILSIRASVKNYSGEVGAFFDWIKAYVDVSDPDEVVFLGHSRYEEDEDPTLYYTTKVVRVRA